MSNQHPIEALAEIRKKLEAQKDAVRKDFEEALRKLEEQIAALNISIALLQEHDGTSPFRVTSANDRDSLVQAVQGKTQVAAMVLIARRHNNKLRLRTAKDVLTRAGILNSKKNGSNILYNAIIRSGRFNRIEPGVYQLSAETDSASTGSLHNMVARITSGMSLKPQ